MAVCIRVRGASVSRRARNTSHNFEFSQETVCAEYRRKSTNCGTRTGGAFDHPSNGINVESAGEELDSLG